MDRAISHKLEPRPSSNSTIRQTMIRTSLELTPQESEQLSKYASDDIYVKQQKEDIEELASKFKEMLSKQGTVFDDEFISAFTSHFVPQKDFSATYQFIIDDNKTYIYIQIDKEDISCKYEQHDNADIVGKLSSNTLSNIIRGRISFQHAFMNGEMAAKGSFKNLRMLDQLFSF